MSDRSATGARLRELGDDPSEEAIAATGLLYEPYQEREPYAGVRVVRDIPYGAHARQRVDVFAGTAASGTARPIVVFAHGGGYVSGDKRLPGTPYYDNVALWAVRHGYLGVTMNYRFAPEFAWPSGADDVGAVVAWVAAHAAEHGGDPARLVLMGHSAGAAHIASYIARTEAPPVAAAILTSGVYDLAVMERSPRHASYFGDASFDAERSSLAGLVASDVPLFVTSVEYEPRKFHPQAASLLRAHVAQRGVMAPSASLPGHTHFSQMFQLNAGPCALSEMLVAFLAERV